MLQNTSLKRDSTPVVSDRGGPTGGVWVGASPSTCRSFSIFVFKNFKTLFLIPAPSVHFSGLFN